MHWYVDTLKAAGQLPVEEQLRHMRLLWLGHVEQMPDHRPQNNSSGADHRGEKARWSFSVVD